MINPIFKYFTELFYLVVDILGSAYFSSFILDGGWNHDNTLRSLEAYEKAVSNSYNLVSVYLFPFILT